VTTAMMNVEGRIEMPPVVRTEMRMRAERGERGQPTILEIETMPMPDVNNALEITLR